MAIRGPQVSGTPEPGTDACPTSRPPELRSARTEMREYPLPSVRTHIHGGCTSESAHEQHGIQGGERAKEFSDSGRLHVGLLFAPPHAATRKV